MPKQVKETAEVAEDATVDADVEEGLDDLPEDLSEDDLSEEDLSEDDLLADEDIDDDDDDDAVADFVDVEEADEEEADPAAPKIVPLETDSSQTDDEDDELDDDDVEASLDVILKERLVVVDDEDDEDDTPDSEDRADGTQRVLPKQPGEFVCQSCFLVKHQGQLADEKRMLCRDCV
ncbi:MAG TPA: DUF4193 family protein [Acidimicrobiales bacterium]|nr:DUF4193 family protein [Acidimicrobiales bacterium]